MKNENDLFESNNENREILLNGKPLKVTSEDPLYMSKQATKKARLLALLAIVTGLSSISLGVTNIVMHQTDNYMGTKYYKYQTAEPMVETQYFAPAGWTLSGTTATRYITETRSADTITTYSAPEGYILIGDKCYKIVEPEEKTKDSLPAVGIC